MTGLALDLDVAREFLDELHGDTPGYVQLCRTAVESDRERMPNVVATSDRLDWLVDQVPALDAHRPTGIYVRTTTLVAPPAPGRRGGDNDTRALPGLWLDVDLAGPGHAHNPAEHGGLVLPPDEAAARKLVAAAELPDPTLWVHSGGGMYPWWLLVQPVDVDDANRAQVKRLSERWHEHVAAVAASLGWHYGAGVGDLARVLRLPGTVNRKTAQGRPCRLLDDRGPRYTLDELHAALPADQTPARSAPPRPAPTGPASSPFDALEQSAAWGDLLAGPPLRWEYIGAGDGGAELWRRPGSTTKSQSAKADRGTSRLLTVFSTETPLPAGRSYSMGQVFAHLHHDGDQRAAARDLVAAARKWERATPAARALPAPVLAAVAAACPRPDAEEFVDPAYRAEQAAPPHAAPPGVPTMAAPFLAPQPPPQVGGAPDPPPAALWPGDPLPLPTLTCLPLDALGPLLGEVVAAVAEQFQVPPDLVVNLALPVITSAAGGSWVVRIREGWTETLALATLTIAGSGERKSPALRALDRALRDHEAALRRGAKTDAAVREVEREVAQQRVDGLRKQLSEALAGGAPLEGSEVRKAYAKAVEQLDALPDDAAPRWLIDDATPEVLAKRLAEHGGLGVISAEPTLFGILLGRYSGGVPNVELYLKATSGDPISVDRVGRDTLHVDHPCLSIGVCIQPGRLAKLGREDRNGTGTVLRDSGMLARFLYAYPGTLLGRRKPSGRPMPRDLADRWRCALIDLAEASRKRKGGEPTTLPFAHDADELLDAYAARLEPRLDPDTGDLAHMADWAAKLVGTCARIAGALTLLGDPSATVVPATAVADALRLGDAYITHAARALSAATIGADSATEAAQVLAWLREHAGPTFTRRDVHQALRGRKWAAQAEALDAPLAVLVEYGHIRRCEQPEQRGPGRPAEVYELHPSNGAGRF